MCASTAIYAGSFNPFTIGHANIVERALNVFDKVVIAIGFNEHKTPSSDLTQRIERISKLYADNQRVVVKSYNGLTVNFAKQFENPVLIRGVRNASEFDDEITLANTNRLISGLDTMFFPTLPELACISSSMVRELNHNDFDTSSFLP